MAQAVILSDADFHCLQLGKLIFQGLASASKIDTMQGEVNRMSAQLEELTKRVEEAQPKI